MQSKKPSVKQDILTYDKVQHQDQSTNSNNCEFSLKLKWRTAE